MKAQLVLLPGDGIGPEVTAAARRMLQLVAETFGHEFDIREQLIGGAAMDAGKPPLPPATLAACRQADAVFLGAVGGPRWDKPDAAQRPEQGLLELRAGLGVYANLRPLRIHPALTELSPLKSERLEGTDILFVRELTGGLYFGRKQALEHEAMDECRYSREEIERIARRAFELARSRRGLLTSVDKANVLATSRLWRRVLDELSADYPDVQLEHQLVDSMAMHLLQAPARYDVVVTENLFGDILTDEAAALAGSLGLLPSASLGEGHRGLYEPAHGSAPDLAGKDLANPTGAILSTALLLRHSLGLEEEATAIESAVFQVLKEGPRSADLGGSAGTQEVTEAIVAALHRKTG